MRNLSQFFIEKHLQISGCHLNADIFFCCTQVRKSRLQIQFGKRDIVSDLQTGKERDAGREIKSRILRIDTFVCIIRLQASSEVERV